MISVSAPIHLLPDLSQSAFSSTFAGSKNVGSWLAENPSWRVWIHRHREGASVWKTFLLHIIKLLNFQHSRMLIMTILWVRHTSKIWSILVSFWPTPTNTYILYNWNPSYVTAGTGNFVVFRYSEFWILIWTPSPLWDELGCTVTSEIPQGCCSSPIGRYGSPIHSAVRMQLTLHYHISCVAHTYTHSLLLEDPPYQDWMRAVVREEKMGKLEFKHDLTVGILYILFM